MTVYLSGRMTGLPDFGREQFNDAEAVLRKYGYKVLNPACLPTDLEGTKYMPICLAMLQQADAIVMLPGWERSKGALFEWQYATAHLDMPVYTMPCVIEIAQNRNSKGQEENI
jgi:nucleoside 2-deoxyribosyltransferase